MNEEQIEPTVEPDAVEAALSHLSGQIDLLNHGVYVQTEYLMFVAAALGIIAFMMMFLVGYIVARGK